MGVVALGVEVAPQSLQGMGLLKGVGVAQENGEEHPGEGDLGRNCLGFRNLREGYTEVQTHTDRRDKKKK